MRCFVILLVPYVCGTAILFLGGFKFKFKFLAMSENLIFANFPFLIQPFALKLLKFVAVHFLGLRQATK